MSARALIRYELFKALAPALALSGLCVVAAFTGAFIDSVGWIWFSGLVVLAVLGVAWPIISVFLFSLTTHVPSQTVYEGGALTVELRMPRRGSILSQGLRLHIEGQVFDVEAGASSDVKTIRVRACGRGRFPSSCATLRSSFPFGLYVAQRTILVKGMTIVRPMLLDVSYPASSKNGTNGLGRLARLGSSGELVGVRPHRRGDSPRQIHWVATARMDRLIAQQRADSSQDVVTIVLDEASFGPVGTDWPAMSFLSNSSYEWAIRSTASMIERWASSGISVVVHGAGWTLRANSIADVGRALDVLALLPSEPTVMPRRARSTTVDATVLITTRTDVALREAATVLTLTKPTLSTAADQKDATEVAGSITSVKQLKLALTTLRGGRQTHA